MTEEIEIGMCLAALERLRRQITEWREIGRLMLMVLELPEHQRIEAERELRLRLRQIGVTL